MVSKPKIFFIQRYDAHHSLHIVKNINAILFFMADCVHFAIKNTLVNKDT